MSAKWCPGSARLRQPKPEFFTCPNCGNEVEIWSDEAIRACPSCGDQVFRMGMQSCLDWCKFAAECVGEEKYKQYGELKAAVRKEALVRAMEDYFDGDTRRVCHAEKVMGYAEQILAEEEGADPNVVLAAAVLHDIGIRNAEARHGSSAAVHQETEGPPVARDILARLEYPSQFVDEVCDIIGHHHHPRDVETVNFKVVYDADLLVNIEETGKGEPAPADSFFTASAGRLGAGFGQEPRS